MKSFRRTVYDHYRKHYRPMPWRDTRDPYRILVSEIMLQQTQVSRVLEKYKEFIRRFPTMRRLGRAPLADVLAAWQGLGYNRRALALKRLAAEVVARYGGKLPDCREALESLPGIGEATAGAIMAYAFNAPAVYIETNIRTVYIHHFFKDRVNVRDEALIPYIEKTLDRKDPREWYYALMDYGVYLKSVLPDPARRSSRYRKQPRFKGSDRQVRGKIMKLLTDKRCMTKAALYRALGEDNERFGRITAALVREGLVRQSGPSVFL